jgi:signal transduction histidine kinase
MSSESGKNGGKKPGLFSSLSGKVLLLTILFVMVGEVLIFLPSIANFRIQWLKARIAQAEVAALAADAAPNQVLSNDLRSQILKGAGVLVVSVKKGERRQLILRGDDDLMIDESFDLRTVNWLAAIRDAFQTMASGNRIISVMDEPPQMTGDLIEIALREEPLRQAMYRFGFNILILSIVLSLLVAAMVFAALNYVIVRPMLRLRTNMLAFGDNPEDRSRIIVPSKRNDELGEAERELRDIQSELANLLQEKSRLAALGLAVSKVSHDLRNMLTSAHLISDRLTMVNDPTVQRFAPKLIASLDRAIEFLSQTLKYGRAQELPPSRERLTLKDIAEDVVGNAVVQASSRIVLYNNVPGSVSIDADREQLNRVLTNLVRNAIQALESRDGSIDLENGSVTIKAQRQGSVTLIEVADNGPGIPEQVRGRLFEAFQSAARPGGTGLGLAIAAELIQAHGGQIELKDSGPTGTIFTISIPDRVAELRTGRRGEKQAAQE